MESQERMSTTTSRIISCSFSNYCGFIDDDDDDLCEPRNRFQVEENLLEKRGIASLEAKSDDEESSSSSCCKNSCMNRRQQHGKGRRGTHSSQCQKTRGGRIMTTASLWKWWSQLIWLVSLLNQAPNAWSLLITPISATFSDAPSLMPSTRNGDSLSRTPSALNTTTTTKAPVFESPSTAVAPVFHLPTAFPTITAKPSLNPSPQPSLPLPELDFYPSSAPTVVVDPSPVLIPTLTNGTSLPHQQHTGSPTKSPNQDTLEPTHSLDEASSSPLPVPTTRPGDHLTPSVSPRSGSFPSAAPSLSASQSAPPSFVPVSLPPVFPTMSPSRDILIGSPAPFHSSPSLVPQSSSVPSSAPTVPVPTETPTHTGIPTVTAGFSPTHHPIMFPSPAPTLPVSALSQTPAPSTAEGSNGHPTAEGSIGPPTATPSLTVHPGFFDIPSSVPSDLSLTSAPTPTVLEGSTASPTATPSLIRHPGFFTIPPAAPTLTVPVSSPPSENPTPTVVSTSNPVTIPSLRPSPLNDMPSRFPPLFSPPTEHPTELPPLFLESPSPAPTFPSSSDRPFLTKPPPFFGFPSPAPTFPSSSDRPFPTKPPPFFGFPSPAPTFSSSSDRPFPTKPPPFFEFPSPAPTLASDFPQVTILPSNLPVKPHPPNFRSLKPSLESAETSGTLFPTPTFEISPHHSESPSSIFPIEVLSPRPQQQPTNLPHLVPFHIPAIMPTTVPLTSPTSKPVKTSASPTFSPTEIPLFFFLPSSAPSEPPPPSHEPNQSPHQVPAPTSIFRHTTTPSLKETHPEGPFRLPTAIPTEGPSLLPIPHSSKRPHQAAFPTTTTNAPFFTVSPTKSEIDGGTLPTAFPTQTSSPQTAPPAFLPLSTPSPSKNSHLFPVAAPHVSPQHSPEPSHIAIAPGLLPSIIPTILPSEFPQSFSWPSPAPTLRPPSKQPHPTPGFVFPPQSFFFPSAAPTLPPPSEKPDAATPTIVTNPTREFPTSPSKVISAPPQTEEASFVPFPYPPNLAPSGAPALVATPVAATPNSPPVSKPTQQQKPSVRLPSARPALAPTVPSTPSTRAPQQAPVVPSVAPQSASPTLAPILPQTISPSRVPIASPMPSPSPTVYHKPSPRYELQVLMLPGAKMVLLGALAMDFKARDDWLLLTGNRIGGQVTAILAGYYEDSDIFINITSLSPPLIGERRRLVGASVTKRQVVQTSTLQVVFDVTISLRSGLTSNPQDLMDFVGGGFETPEGRAIYLTALRDTNDTAFANVYNLSLTLPFITSVNGIHRNEEGGPNSAGLIVGIVAASVISAVLLAVYLYLRRQRRIGSEDEKDEIQPASETVAAPQSVEDNEFTSEINVESKGDISTLGDPIGTNNMVSGGPDHSVADSFSLDFDFQRAYHRNENTSGSESNDSNSNLMVLKDDDTFDLQYYSQEQFDVEAPPGMLGLILETSSDGVPTVHAIKATSPIANEVAVGDRLLSVDGEDVTVMLSSDVSRLISSRRDNVVRRFVFSRPPNNNKKKDQPPPDDSSFQDSNPY